MSGDNTGDLGVQCRDVDVFSGVLGLDVGRHGDVVRVGGDVFVGAQA